MLGICFFDLGENTLRTPDQEKGLARALRSSAGQPAQYV